MTTVEKLKAPFAQEEIKFFPKATTSKREGNKYPTGTKAMPAAYAEARVYMDRLDEVLGQDGWSTTYQVIDATSKAVECSLSVKYDDTWITKADVGYPNDARDASDASQEPLKAAYSEAFKRACVQHGVGRFLYRITYTQDWWPIDERGRFTLQPTIAGAKAAPKTAQPEAAPGQWGSFTATDGSFDSEKWTKTLAETHVSPEALKQHAPKGGSAWLKDNPGKTLDDLLLLASQEEAA